jgi:exodeoxyribonuclease-3
MKPLKVATYNVNSIRSRMHILLPWLNENRPDILCMQETKVDDASFPAEDFRRAGYRILYCGSKQYNGVAIASLEEPGDVSCGLDDGEPADEDRLIRARIAGITVITAYVPQGRDREHPMYPYKLRWFARLKDFLARKNSPNDPLLLCGDLNVAPEPIDVHDPKRLLGHVCFNPEVWEAFASVKDWGLTDLYRKHHPAEPGRYTFFDYRSRGSVEKGLGWRIDHMLVTEPLARRSNLCEIDMKPRLADKPSDHTVLFAEFGGNVRWKAASQKAPEARRAKPEE